MIELLAPAGNPEALRGAVYAGADAVYFGAQTFNARAEAGNFGPDELERAFSFCRTYGVKAYITLNTLVSDRELPDALALIDGLCALGGPDALIVQDLGLAAALHRRYPALPLHASTQMGFHSTLAVPLLRERGFTRVVLARELSLPEIREIRARVPEKLELETFCHGAMCVSYSGRCLLSNYMTGRDSNRGECAQPCRYQYALMEEKRPGEYFPVFEDEKGTYIMNSRDMCMIDHLDDLMDAGIDCLKIEGRAKSAYYAAIVTGAYRHVLDDLEAGRAPDPVWRDEVEHVSHRHYSTGFFYGQPGQYTENSRYLREWQICAVVERCDADGNAVLSLRNKFRTGDTVELVGPDFRPILWTAGAMEDMDGIPLSEPRTPQMRFRAKLPCCVPELSFVRHAVELSPK